MEYSTWMCLGISTAKPHPIERSEEGYSSKSAQYLG